MSDFSPVTTDALKRLIREYEKAEAASKRAMATRAAFGPGDCVSRKGRWTTANARWASAAEERDRCLDSLTGAMKKALSFGVEVAQ